MDPLSRLQNLTGKDPDDITREALQAHLERSYVELGFNSQILSQIEATLPALGERFAMAALLQAAVGELADADARAWRLKAGAALRHLGYNSRQMSIEGVRQRIWFKPPAEAASSP